MYAIDSNDLEVTLNPFMNQIVGIALSEELIDNKLKQIIRDVIKEKTKRDVVFV